MGIDIVEDNSVENIKTEECYVRQAYTEFSPLTGLYFSRMFFQKAGEFLVETKPGSYCMVAIDLEHFRLFNKLYGREEGDKLLIQIADVLKAFRKANGGVVGYMGGDNYGVVMPYHSELLMQLNEEIKTEIGKWNNTVGFLPALGIYVIDEPSISAATMYDRATIALSHVIGNYVNRICEYSQDMEEKVEEEIKLLSEIQVALEREEFTFFVQPQCDIASGKIVGGESLVRWQHSTKGMISPGIFVPVLEKNGFIADLDRYVWKKVCQWLRSWIDKGYQPVPISINVSRIDIFSMDVPAYLTELLQIYDLPAKLLKVEITESAYAESNDKIIRAVKQLRDADFLVMMDDFGSGYSSLNMLKSVAVDVLKIDMRFLDINENEEEKGIGILESVVSMARQMRMPIIVEGVETQKQESFLLKMGCRYTQGYYYYKPLPITEFERLISDERNLDLNGFWCKQTESLHLKEFFDENLFNDAMVNNILGAAAFYEMYDNRIEITRVNEQYYRLAGISFGEKDYYKKFWNHVRDDDRQVLFGIFEEAYEKPADGARGNIHFVREDGKVLWVYMRVFFLREREGRRFYYSSLTDVTSIHDNGGESNSDIQRIGDLTKEQREQLIQSYGNLPCGYCVARVLLDTVGNPADYQIVYANSAAERTIGGTTDRFRYMMRRSFGEDNQELLNKAYKAAYLGEEQDYSVYSTIASCYLRLKIYQYDYGYAGCLLQDVTNAHIQEDMMNNIMRAYREVYYIHLQDNYYRMVYPEDNLLLERGNYEESINRHFGTGKILLEDEQNIRRFLSLEHLKEALVKQNTVEYKYRRRVNEIGEEWCLTTIAVCERQNGIPKTAVMTIRSIEALMREKEGKKHQNMAQVLANMSDGFFIYRATDDEKILYANPSVLRIFGCKAMDEFRELVGNSFHGMVHPDDIERVRWEISEQVKHSDSKMDFILYRIVRKDGEIRWIDDCGHLEDSDSDNDTKLFYVFISDITDSITKQQKEKLIQQSSNYKKQ